MKINPEDIIHDPEDKDQFICPVLKQPITRAYCKSHAHGQGCGEYHKCLQEGVFDVK